MPLLARSCPCGPMKGCQGTEFITGGRKPSTSSAFSPTVVPGWRRWCRTSILRKKSNELRRQRAPDPVGPARRDRSIFRHSRPPKMGSQPYQEIEVRRRLPRRRREGRRRWWCRAGRGRLLRRSPPTFGGRGTDHLDAAVLRLADATRSAPADRPDLPPDRRDDRRLHAKADQFCLHRVRPGARRSASTTCGVPERLGVAGGADLRRLASSCTPWPPRPMILLCLLGQRRLVRVEEDQVLGDVSSGRRVGAVARSTAAYSWSRHRGAASGVPGTGMLRRLFRGSRWRHQMPNKKRR